MPDNSPNANNMDLSISLKKPNFKVKVIELPKLDIQKQSFIDLLIYGDKNHSEYISINDFSLSKKGIIAEKYLEKSKGEEILIPFSKWPKSMSPNDIANKYIYKKTYLLGTDKYGRDFLSRLILGSRISFFIGLFSVMVSFTIGVFLGVTGGYFKGFLDRIVMFIINIFWSVPSLLLVIATILTLGKGFEQVFIAIGVTTWVDIARISRSEALSLSEYKFVKLSKVIGYSHFRIITKDILPNIINPVLIICASNFATSILMESGLSFLGIGVQPPLSSWGRMIKENYHNIILGKYHLAILPGIAIMSLIFSIIFIVNMIHNRMNIKARH